MGMNYKQTIIERIPLGNYDIQVQVTYYFGNYNYYYTDNIACQSGVNMVGNSISINGENVAGIQSDGCTGWGYQDTILSVNQISFKGDGTDLITLHSNVDECIYQIIYWGVVAVQTKFAPPLPLPEMVFPSRHPSRQCFGTILVTQIAFTNGEWSCGIMMMAIW